MLFRSHLIGYLALQATGYQSLGKTEPALNHLSRALSLAEPEGYVRTFVDLGPEMQELLRLAAGQDMCRDYVGILLSAFATAKPPQAHLPALSAARPLSPIQEQPIEPLGERETQILQLMSARLTNREIAEELYLSVNTVKWYARSIYEKLGVANRREAGSRAVELGIISTNPGWRPGGR